MDGGGLAVDFDKQFALGGIWAQVDAGGKEAAHERAGVVAAAQGLASELDNGGFGAVSDEFEGVEEVLSASAGLGDLLVRWEVFEFVGYWRAAGGENRKLNLQHSQVSSH